MQNWSNMIKAFQDGLSGMPEEDKMRLPGEVIESILFNLTSLWVQSRTLSPT